MADTIKAPKVAIATAADPYVVTADDYDLIIEIVGSPVILPEGLTPGFYTTFVNKRGGTIQITVENGLLSSPLGGSTMTRISEQCTVYLSTTGWIAPSL